MLSVGHVVTTSVGMCDIDIRPVSIRLILLVNIFISHVKTKQLVAEIIIKITNNVIV
jgi:hypothetical protein